MSQFGQEVPDVDDGDLPEVADDNSPENASVPDPEQAALPGDAPVGVDATGTTAEEALEGESLDEKLARERSD